ncbi:uncharacterized protein [Diabrotica undecimpunctata]|uniref:uncharacterized protein n=1 Tax=Diabrotica undecimpunctata TaxID=50387 RepID=UPI003B63CAAE
MSGSLVMQKPPVSSKNVVVIDLESRREEINPKLAKVLKKLLDPKFKLYNKDYLNLLLTHLTSKEHESKFTPHQIETHKKFLTIWLKGYVVQCERLQEPPNASLLTFVLNITRYLCESEQIFVHLNSDDIFERLVKIIKKVSQPTVTGAFIKLFGHFVEHKSGLQWMISTNHWELLVDIILNNETVFVYKEGNKFVAKMLEKSHSFNVPFCKNVIQHILVPLDECYKAIVDHSFTESQERWLISTLRLISEILYILLGPEAASTDSALIAVLLETFQLNKRLKEILGATTHSVIKGWVYRTVIYLSLYELKLKFIGNQRAGSHQKAEISPVVFNVLYEAANEISVPCMLLLLFTTLNCWNTIKASLPGSLLSNPKVVSFEDQLLAIQLMPMYTIFVKTIGFNVYTSDSEDSFRYIFISKLVDRIYPKTIRVKYKWQNYLLEHYSITNGILALKYFIHSKQLYSKENAILAFQMMIYLIEDLNTCLKDKPELQLQFINEPDYLDLHLKVIAMIIDEFQMTWQDTVESLCVLHIVYHLLNGLIWPTKIVVTALKLAEKGISKYMTFDLALLIDDTEDSIMHVLPALLRVKLHDGAWEVRDSTIELLQSLFMTAINTKFTSYKKLLLENDLPCSVLRMATDDGNPFVRASAVRCVHKAIEIPEFWEALTNSFNFYDIVLRILQYETEGIVRCEAATLVDCIFTHQSIPQDLMNSFYDAMNHAVVADLHWEVRVKALKFWKNIIDEHLTQQGMIDGSFPSVTFSKELKKIVTLSNLEVEKRLVRVLNELSQVGCLSVFYEALQDDCDIEVSKTATNTIKEFVDLLKNHQVTVQSLQVHTPTPTTPVSPVTEKVVFPPVAAPQIEVDDFIMPTAPSTPQYAPISDSILEDILDTRDLNLLETVFNKLDEPSFKNIDIKKRQALKPELFLNLVYTDLERRLVEKSQWREQTDSFQSLLDDILKEYDNVDVNNMDCY